MQKMYLLIGIIIVLFIGNVNDENFDMMIFSGYSMFDDGFKIYWQPSYNVGLKAFYHVSKYIHLGGYISYGILSPRDGNLLYGLGCTWTDSGDGESFEIVPSMRLSYPIKDEKTYIYTQ